MKSKAPFLVYNNLEEEYKHKYKFKAKLHIKTNVLLSSIKTVSSPENKFTHFKKLPINLNLKKPAKINKNLVSFIIEPTNFQKSKDFNQENDFKSFKKKKESKNFTLKKNKIPIHMGNFYNGIYLASINKDESEKKINFDDDHENNKIKLDPIIKN